MKVGEKIWHCKRTPKKNAGYSIFELPQEYTTRFGYITVQPSGSSYSELAEYGEEVKNYRTAIAQPYEKWNCVFNEGDRAYLDGKIPSEADLDDMYAGKANYIVDSVQPQNKAIRIIFKKRTAE